MAAAQVPSSTGPSSPNQPDADTRKPVITSSDTSRAPYCRVIRRIAAVKPGCGGTTPMLPAAASVIRQAIRSPCAAKAASRAATSL